MRFTYKGQQMEWIIERAKKALSNDYYIETIFSSTSVIEERLISILKKHSRKHVKFEKDIDSFSDIIINDVLLTRLVDPNIISRLHNLRKSRNKVAHDLVKNTNFTEYSDLEELAIECHDVMIHICAVLQNWKKNKDK